MAESHFETGMESMGEDPGHWVRKKPAARRQALWKLQEKQADEARQRTGELGVPPNWTRSGWVFLWVPCKAHPKRSPPPIKKHEASI